MVDRAEGMLFFGAVGALAPVDGILVWAWQRAGLLVAVLLLGAAGRSGSNLIFSFHWTLLGTGLPGPAVWGGAGCCFRVRRAISIDEFCRRHNLSRQAYCRMRRRGRGPREMRPSGRRVLISQRALEQWERDNQSDLQFAAGAT